MKHTDLENWCLARMREAGIPEPLREYRFHPKRRWLLDFAWPSYRVGVEIQGGAYVRGRHLRPAGYSADLEKAREAQLIGWILLAFPTPRRKRDGWGIEIANIRRALELRGYKFQEEKNEKPPG